jgi:hypothetical protein
MTSAMICSAARPASLARRESTSAATGWAFIVLTIFADHALVREGSHASAQQPGDAAESFAVMASCSPRVRPRFIDGLVRIIEISVLI